MKEISKGIYSKIVELADTKLQRKLWLNENNETGLISSYTELMCTLFDDFSFDDFIDNTAIKDGLSKVTVAELDKLRDMLNNYNEKELDVEIINDPEWKKIVDQANIVLNVWYQNLHH